MARISYSHDTVAVPESARAKSETSVWVMESIALSVADVLSRGEPLRYVLQKAPADPRLLRVQAKIATDDGRAQIRILPSAFSMDGDLPTVAVDFRSLRRAIENQPDQRAVSIEISYPVMASD